MLHFCHAEVAVFQTGQAVDLCDVPVIENAAVVRIPLHIGDKSLIAVEFQSLIIHIGQFTSLLHRVHRHSPEKSA